MWAHALYTTLTSLKLYGRWVVHLYGVETIESSAYNKCSYAYVLLRILYIFFLGYLWFSKAWFVS